MRRLCWVGVSLVLGGLLWRATRVSRLSWRMTPLQREITQQLQQLSVDFEERGSQERVAPPLLAELGDLRHCQIPTEIQHTCVDTVESVLSPPPWPLQQLARHCDLLKQLHAYDHTPDEEETDFPLAFGIKMHGSAAQAEQLLRAIYRPHNVYCIYVDGKADAGTFRAMAAIAGCFPNVVLTDRVDLVYGGPSMVRAELLLMACTLKLHSRLEVLPQSGGAGFTAQDQPGNVLMPEQLRGRVTHVHTIQRGRVVRTHVRKSDPPFRAQIRQGTQYGAFCRAFVTSVLHDDVAKSVINYFSDTYSSDETVWATLNGFPGTPGGYSMPPHAAQPAPVDGRGLGAVRRLPLSRALRAPRVRVLHARPALAAAAAEPGGQQTGGEAECAQAAACLEAVLGRRARRRVSTVSPSYVLGLPHVRARHGAPGVRDRP
ncbi:hypothetical protein ACOMHN_022895 [Nucella lapillus]